MEVTQCILSGWETPLWAEVLCFLFVNLVADGMFGTLIVQLRVALVYSDTGDNPDTAPGSHPTNWENRPKEKKLKRKKLLNLIQNASFVKIILPI